MYTINDYLKYYNKTPVTAVHWNAIDNLVCAILVYLPVDSFKESKTLLDFYNYALLYKNKEASGAMVSHAYNILEKVITSDRYQDLTVSNFICLKNEDTQFGAAKFRLKDLTIVSYKGTDGSLIGWIENFRLGYQYPTNTHLLAIGYLNQNITSTDKKVYVTGHSKGGNLAMVSALEASDELFSKIEAVYNFDGPGFKKEEFLDQKYNRLQKKLVNIIPTGSVVGVILNNKNYHVIKSEEFAFNEHYPTTWNIFGEYFIEGPISSISMQLHESTTVGIEKLNQQKMEESLETIFKSLKKEYSSKFKITFNDLKNLYLNMKEVDPEVKRYLDTIFDSMLRASYPKEKDN